MDNSKFNVFEAVRDAYFFIGREWRYLLKAGMIPMIVHMATSLFVQYARPDAGVVESYLWGLPATVLFAWFVFLEARLLLLGERIDKLPADTSYLRWRARGMKASVLTGVLFNMGLMGSVLVMALLTNNKDNAALAMLSMVVICFMFWALRFGVLAVAAAVNYPLKRVIEKTWGMMFSVRLAGLGLLSLLPVALFFQVLLSSFVRLPKDATLPLEMTAAQQAVLTVLSAPMSLSVAMVLNAAVAFALKQVLGRQEKTA